jgi:uncharacterized protein (TIGR03437 family)
MGMKHFRGIVTIIVSGLFFGSFLMAQEWQKGDDDKQAERQDWFYSQRTYPQTSIPAGARLNAIRQIQRMEAAQRAQRQAAALVAAGNGINLALTTDPANWSLIGPRPTDAGSSNVTSGRVNAIAIDPRNSDVVYIGAAEGGVWKTTDGGTNWTPLTDDQPSLATGSIALDPNNPDTVYVGTGEENFAQDSYYGAGILKSVNGGITWTNVVGPFLRDKVGALAVHPTNSQILLAAATAGVWRSADAGATWTQTLSGAAGISLVFDPTNGASAYATLGTVGGNAQNGVYHSSDAGLTWQLVNGTGTGALPATRVGRIELAMAPSDPATLYAQIAVATSALSGGGTLMGIYKTTDAATTWSKLTIPIASAWGPQLWYDNTIRVSPADPNVIYAGGQQIFRSLNGGDNWVALAQTGLNNTFIHVDFHYLAFTPDGSKLYIANDGGIYSTTDVTAARPNWTSLNNTLALTQFYPGFSVDPADPRNAIGGTQDNGTQRFGGAASWSNVTCGDGGFAAIDPSFPAIAYGACQDIEIEKTSALTGSAGWIPASYGIDQTDITQFISPLAMDPSNPQTLYFGTYRVWQSQDSAGRWSAASPDLTGGKKGTLKAIAVAPSDSNTVYIGTSNSKIQVTTDAQDGAAAAWTDRSAGLPPRTVTHIAVDPIDSATAYVTFSGFPPTTGISNDPGGHVFKTGDGGASWTDISGNLPVIPVNAIVVDPDLPQTLYIGTDAGVMVTTDGGATWSSLGTGLPRVVVFSLVLQRNSRVMRAATHGRSVWEILVPLLGPALQPAIGSISPATADFGSGAFTLNVTGSNFGPRTLVRWNGQNRTTTLVDDNHLTAQIPASDIAAVGRASVLAFTAASGGGASNATTFSIGPAPQTNGNAFVSAANPTGGNVLARGSIGSLFGLNLSARTAVADLAPPLPFTLGGTSMTIGGTITPLFFVSPAQINFQVPFLAVARQTAVPLVITQGVVSTAVTVQITPTAPALFTTNAQGTGQASALIAGTASVVSPAGTFPGSRPAKPGEFISIYCTGLGDVTNRPALGSASPTVPLAMTLTTPTVTIGGVSATVAFSGLAPGFAGLYQVNVQVPAAAPSGAAVPIVLAIGGFTANPATIAVDPAQ